MANAENLDWLHRLKSEIYVYMPEEWLIPMGNALDEAIKALSEPTIPSVIEKITETMEAEYASADELADWFSDGDKTEASFYRGKASGIKWVKGIINNTVSEVTHGKD